VVVECDVVVVHITPPCSTLGVGLHKLDFPTLQRPPMTSARVALFSTPMASRMSLAIKSVGLVV